MYSYLRRSIVPIGTGSLLSIILVFSSVGACSDEFRFHHENVLGTSLEMRVATDSLHIANAVEQCALAEIDRLSEIYSGYSKTSELAGVLQQPVGRPLQLSAELAELLRQCETWRKSSRGAFNPAVELFSRRWKLASEQDEPPSPIELANLAAKANSAIFTLAADSTDATRNSELPLNINAIAKGTILDKVVAKVVREHVGLKGLAVDIGGDIRVAGDISQSVEIADPLHDSIGASTRQTVLLRQCGIATSGVSERYLLVNGRRVSHILDPRTGEPCSHVLSATVVAPSAETADVLATVCCVMSIEESLAYIDSFENAACLLIDRRGREFRSTAWTQQPPLKFISTPLTQERVSKHQFKVNFEIAKSDQGGRYRRPYVAVWVEDHEGFPVKTLSLFLMTNNPGPRWHRDLRRWYSSEQMRALVDKTKLIGVISKPTRNPGEYHVEWDGTDDNGKPLSDGKYTLYIEAAREHGSYQLIKHPFEIGGEAFTKELKGNVEIKAATLEYQPSKGDVAR